MASLAIQSRHRNLVEGGGGGVGEMGHREVGAGQNRCRT